MDWHITFYKEANEGKKDQVRRRGLSQALGSMSDKVTQTIFYHWWSD
jgi:hypothetical protein